jgi:hypothetical protein
MEPLVERGFQHYTRFDLIFNRWLCHLAKTKQFSSDYDYTLSTT